MFTKTAKILLFLVSGLIIGVSSVHANIYGQSIEIVDLQDQRTFLADNYSPANSDGGLSGSYAGFFISWNIGESSPGSGLWNYEYIYGGIQDPSSFILELTDENTVLTNITLNDPLAVQEGPQVWTQNGNTEFKPPTYGGSLFGMKWETNDTNPITISFQTTSDPVWGNFHVISQSEDVQAYNRAFGNTGFVSTRKLDFIARPDGGGSAPIVPEPVSSTLFIVGGATLGFRQFRK
jgi:hypothetical protein